MWAWTRFLSVHHSDDSVALHDTARGSSLQVREWYYTDADE